MPETYLDSSIVGFNHQDALDLNVDTYRRLSPILNMEDAPAINEKFAYNLSYLTDGRPSDTTPDIPKISMGEALVSQDPVIKKYALAALDQQARTDPKYKYGLGRAIESPYDSYAKKYWDKDYGYSALRDNEDFYYRNTWGQMSTFGRMWRTPFKMAARIIPQTFFKLMEGLGYTGSMLLNLPKFGTDDYWANVADNAFSRWFEEGEQRFKDQIIPVYKQAGFDEKGFFSKLVDSAFWNDEVADGVAFLASAAVPGMALSKIGKIGAVGGQANWFGKAFSTTSKLGKTASWAGLGSWAELSSWTFNTAMESAVEGAGVFKEVKRKLEEERANGLNNMSDDEIRRKAGSMAGNTVRGNFAVLALSNAWENTLFFKPLKTPQSGRGLVKHDNDFTASSRALDDLVKRNPFASPLSRTNVYGKKLMQGILAEGVWEENAQLAIQRMNQDEAEGRTGLGGFFSQLSKQTMAAFAGKDKEASESIGLGALIGAGAGVGFTKLGNERRHLIKDVERLIRGSEAAKQNLFDYNDVYETDENNKLVWDGNEPKIDPKKLAEKEHRLKQNFGALSLASDTYHQTEPVKFATRKALFDYVHSMRKLGFTDLSQKFASISPETAVMFGMDPSKIKEEASEFASLTNKFEAISEDVEKNVVIPPIPLGTTPKQFAQDTEDRLAQIRRLRSENVIIEGFKAERQSKILESLNKTRNLNNASIAQFPVDQLNTLIRKKINNDKVIKSKEYENMSDIEKQYHIDRDKQLTDEIEQHKKNNETILKDSTQVKGNPYYSATKTDANGNVEVVPVGEEVAKGILAVADYDDVTDKNNYFNTLFSDNTKGHENYLKFLEDSLAKQVEAANKAIEAQGKKFKELQPGDFAKVTALVAKMVFRDDNTTFTDEELQLQQNYGDLISEILPKYEDVIEQYRLNVLKSRLAYLKKEQEAIAGLIKKVEDGIAKDKSDLETLRDELDKLAKGKKADRKKLTESINKLSANIDKAEQKILLERQKLAPLEAELQIIEGEAVQGGFRKLYQIAEEQRRNIDSSTQKLNETLSLLDELKKIFDDIIGYVKTLLPGFKFRTLGSFDDYAEKNKDVIIGTEALEARGEVAANLEQRLFAQRIVDSLNSYIPKLQNAYSKNQVLINNAIKGVNDYFAKIYLDTTKKAPPTVSADTDVITKGLTKDKAQFPASDNSGGEGYVPEAGFDGDNYIRPLHTKFFTSTNVWVQDSDKGEFKRYKDAPENTQDFFDLLEYITDGMNTADVTKKLKGKNLRLLLVTRNNYKQLGLQDVLSDRKDKDGRSFFENEDPENAHIEMIPVIEDAGYYYYTDKQLNKLQRVGDVTPVSKKADRPSPNLVRTVLRFPYFKQWEKGIYAQKYLGKDAQGNDEVLDSNGYNAAMRDAVQTGIDFRQQLLNLTTSQPTLIRNFTITRGIPNKLKREDGLNAENPVTSVILSEAAITGDSLRVFTGKDPVILNGIPIQVPAGRPFIFTRAASGYAQLHAADNRQLTEEQIGLYTRILHDLVVDHVAKVMAIVNSNTKEIKDNLKTRIAAVGLNGLNEAEKTALYLQLTATGKPLFNTNYTTFLGHVLYFDKLQKDENDMYKEPGDNQIYALGPYFMLGKTGNSIDLTNPQSAYSDQVLEFLRPQFHNVKYLTTEDSRKKEFFEYYLEDNELQVRTWDTYAHYMLSSKFPDGTARGRAPITTAIKTKAQNDLEKDPDKYYRYLSRGVVIENDSTPSDKRKTTTKTRTKDKPVETTSSADSTPSSEAAKRSPRQAMDSTKSAVPADEKKKETAKKEAPKQEPPKQEPPGKRPTTDGLPDYDDNTGPRNRDEFFRVAQGGVFKKEEDLDGLVADIARMIPQFPVERLKNIIKSIDGIEAWGQFKNGTIYLYELAEKGTGYHEVFEAVANRLLTDAEWNAISKEFRARKGTFKDRETGVITSHKKANDHQIKEQLAEEFMDYKLTGKLPSDHQTRSYLKIMWDWIKKFILNLPTIDSLFTKIDEGKFAHTKVRSSDRFAVNFRLLLPELPAKVKQDLSDLASVTMFTQVFFSAESLTSFDELKYNDVTLYENVKAKFEDTIKLVQSNKQAEIDRANSTGTLRNEQLIRNYNATTGYLQYALDNWKDFVAFHKEKLKPFNIKFVETNEEGAPQGDLSQEQIEMRNRNDYAGDEFKTVQKNSAAKSIRFLFGTLIEKKYDPDGIMTTVQGLKVPASYMRPSTVYGPIVADYDRYMFQALQHFKGLSSMTDIENKLKQISGLAELERLQNPEAKKEFIRTLTEEQAVWTSLYVKVFGYDQRISEEAVLNLKTKFQNYTSKHAPFPMVLLWGAGNPAFISSHKRGLYESLLKKVVQSVTASRDLLFTSSRQADGSYVWVANNLFKKEASWADFTQIKSDSKSGRPPYMDFAQHIGLEKQITQEFVDSLSEEERNHLIAKLLKIRNAMTKVRSKFLDIKGLNIFGFMTKESAAIDEQGLIPFLDERLNLAEIGSQYFNIDNQVVQTHVVPSYVSRIVHDMNNMSRDMLLLKYPQLGTFFASSSIVMEKMYEKDGTRKKDYSIALGYTEGIKDTNEAEGTKASKLELPDKYALQFSATLAGMYYSLPADSETEWVFKFGEFTRYSENMLKERGSDIVNKLFIPKLRSEIETAIVSTDELLQFREIHPSTGFPVGKSLRFFKDILGKKLSDKIHQAIADNVDTDTIVSSNMKEIRAAILSYLRNEVENTKTILEKKYRLVGGSAELGYMMGFLENNFVEKNKLRTDQGNTILTQAQYDGVVAYQKINSILGAWEQFQLFYGDPAQYKDWEKRAKSLFGPMEQTYYDNHGTVNTWLTANKNFAVLGNEQVQIGVDDWFRREFSNRFTSRTVNDFGVVETDTVNDLQNIIDNGEKNEAQLASDFIKSYATKIDKNGVEKAQIEETDGQSVGTILFARELFIKSGWRWTKGMEDYFQYDTALMRQELSRPSTPAHLRYSYGNNTALRELDAKIVENFKKNPPASPITPVKTLMPFQDKKGNQHLYKHSVYFASYQTAKEFELLETYVDMLKRGDDLLNFKSAHKVGLTVDKQGKISNYYDDPFTKRDITSDEIDNPRIFVDFRTVGIQVETQSSGNRQTLGTQSTKDINLNLFEGGIPYDFGGLSKKEEWDQMEEGEKLASSEFYRMVKGENGTIKTLEDLKKKNTIDTLSKIGIPWELNDQGAVTFAIKDMTKIREYILDEMKRLQIDENALTNIELNEEGTRFLRSAETLPSYTTITNLLWSLADNSTTSITVNGKSYIQVSSAFFNKKSRQSAYYDQETKRWITVDNKADHDRLAAEGKKLFMTSSELKFYRKGDDGKTLGMEVYLPHIYKKKVNDKREAAGLPRLSDEELMDHLNKDPRLLQGVGFRIPTQATSSIEFFTIKGFLPENFGTAVVVPSAITTKGGSDFDVDKLSTYLNNWKLDKNGLPFYEEYKDDSNSTYPDRYVSFIKGLERDYNVVFNDMKTNPDFDEIADVISEGEEELRVQKEMLDIAKNAAENVYNQGLDIFRDLPLGIKQQYYKQERTLRSNNINGAEKALEYLAYTDKWIKTFSDGKGVILPVEKKVRGQIIVAQDTITPEEVLPIFNDMVENYKQFLKEVGLTEELLEEYRQMKREKRDERKGVIETFRFEVAQAIAKKNGYVTSDNFRKLPMYMQNTKGALENRYFKSMRTVLEHPYMFTYLLSPNSLRHVKEMRDAVYDALGKEKDESKELNYSNFLSTEYISEKRNDFTAGKYNIGIFAVAMTNYANSQVVGLNITPGTVRKEDKMVFDEMNDGRIDLPFAAVKIQYAGDRPFIPISLIRDADGRPVMDKISSHVNGAVDVVKEPASVQMGMHTEFAGVYMLMERMGLTGKTTALFLYQPAVREYLEEVIFLPRNNYFGKSAYNGRPMLSRELAEGWANMAGIKGLMEYDPNIKFTDEQLIAMIKKGEKVKADPSKYKWTKEEAKLQYHVLVNMLKMKMLSNHLLESIQASNHDVSKIRSPWVLTKKDLGLARSNKGNLIASIEGDTVKGGAQSLIDETFVKTDKSMLTLFSTLFAQTGLFSLQKSNPKGALNNVAARIYKQNTFISDDEFIRLMRYYESSMVDILVNKMNIPFPIEEGKRRDELYKYSKQLFTRGLASNLNNRFRALKAARDSEGNFLNEKFINNNFFLSNLSFHEDQVAELDLMQLNAKKDNENVLTRERITEAIRQLLEVDPNQNRDMAEFGKALVIGAYLQFGIRFSRDSFLDLIPSESITALTDPPLKNIQNADFKTFDEEVQRAHWDVKGVVRMRMFNSVNMVSPTENGMMKLEAYQRKRIGDWKTTKMTKTTQTFFGSRTPSSQGGVLPSIHPMFVYAGKEGSETAWVDMEDIIGVPAVKPEYLIPRKDIEGNVFLSLNKDEIAKMKKRGDHSYLFVQLFKKVGVENPSNARYILSGGKEKAVHYLYKPIHKYGKRGFNETVPLLLTPDGTILADPSIIPDPYFKEWEDGELMSVIDNEGNKIQPVFSPTDTGKVIVSFKVPENTDVSSRERIQMHKENVAKIEAGTKTTTIRTITEATKIGIDTGTSGVRYIGDKQYDVSNRGYLTIAEAGGLDRIAKSEGWPTAPTKLNKHEVKGVSGTAYYTAYENVKRWAEGVGRMYVYDIRKIGDEGGDQGGEPPVEPDQPEQPTGGVNIYSGSTDPLGRALTNPIWGSKKDGKKYFDVETAYKAAKSRNPDPAEALREDMNTMYTLINKKLRQNPELIDEINARGGLPFIQASTHTKNDGTPIVKGSRWEGKGMESNFIKVLAKSYEKVSKELGKYVGPEQEIIEEQPAEPEQPREKKFTYEGKTIETEFPLGIEQEAALKKLIDFVKKGNTLNAMTLQGAAGTGKTAVIGYLQKFLGNRYTFAYMAPTHAATAELGFATAKTGSHQLPATVASSLTFNPVKGNVFSQKISKRLGLNPVIVVDESSMLDNEDIKKLVEATNDAGGRIIFLGDEKQIPKVTKGEDMDDMELLLTGGSSTKNVSPVFTKFDKAVMTKIFRQSNNSLLSLLAAVREQTDFKLFRVPNSNSVKFLNKREYNQELEKDIETDAENTVVVAYTNDAVKGENKKIRSTLGRTGETVVGDILMGYLGYATKQIEKGDVANSISYTLTGIDKEGSTVNLTMKSDKLVRLQKLGIQGIPSTATTTYYQMSKDDSLTFDHLTDKDFENNNKDISSIFARIHQANQDYAAKKITYATYLGLIAGYGDTLRRYSVGDRYVYNPSTKRMEKFDKKKHKGIKTTGNGTLLFEKDIDYGHAITIHKSQGATIDNVYFDTTSLTIARNTPIIDNKGNRITTERQSLVYVAMSRSKKKLVVYMGDNDFELLGSQQKQQPKAPPESDDQFPPDITFFSSDDIEPPGYPPINPRC